MIDALYIFIVIVGYFFIGGLAVAKLFGSYPSGSYSGDEQAIYILGIMFWPVSVIIGAAKKGVELASGKNKD